MSDSQFFLRTLKTEKNPAILTQLFEEYINECKYCTHLSPETIRGYIAVFTLFLKVMPEVTELDLMTSGMLVEFFKRIETRARIVGRNTLKVGVKGSTIKTQYSKLNAFFAWLVRKAYLKENPLQNIKPPCPIYDDPQALTNEEIHKIYSAVTLHSSNAFTLRRDTMMVSLLLYCGIRKGEFISLLVSDLDLPKREIIIRAISSKSQKTRILKLHPTLLLHLHDYLNVRKARGLKTEYLIAANNVDRGLSREGLKHWVKRINQKSGVVFHLHKFRHTFACKLAEADVHPFKIQKMMGHTSITMTLKYTRSMSTESMGDDINKISFTNF